MRYYKTIDFYISRKFLGTFFYSIALIISIAIVFDISENLDEFISKDIPTKDIVFREKRRETRSDDLRSNMGNYQ